eukprot:GHVU01015922.1.p1 GENE.GHVU01015922.1~~GHVU01015922.1.p1  ORF type:complete len:158 (+),score=22.52 GHVU01015922.1:159-632(+)
MTSSGAAAVFAHRHVADLPWRCCASCTLRLEATIGQCGGGWGLANHHPPAPTAQQQHPLSPLTSPRCSNQLLLLHNHPPPPQAAAATGRRFVEGGGGGNCRAAATLGGEGGVGDGNATLDINASIPVTNLNQSVAAGSGLGCPPGGDRSNHWGLRCV